VAGPAHLCLVPIQWAKLAHPIGFHVTLPSGPRCLTDPTCQPHFFAGGKPLHTRPATAPITLKPISFPLLRLQAARRHNFGRPGALEPCPSAAPLRARCCAVWPHRALRRPFAPLHACATVVPELSPRHQSSASAPEAEGSPTNQGHDRTLMRLLGCR
jgi:hypothetical protein